LIGGDVITVPTREWDTYAAMQQSKAEDILRALLDKDKPKKTSEMFPNGVPRPAAPDAPPDAAPDAAPDAGDTDLPEDAGEASP